MNTRSTPLRIEDLNGPKILAPERRWEGLDLLRGIAACMVFAFHYVGMTWTLTQGNSIWEGFEVLSLMSGSIGTNLLLMLSGFLIGKSLSGSDFSYSHFLKRRSLRIYVPYVAILSMAGLFAWVFPAFGKDHPGQSLVSYYLQQLLLLPGLFPSRPMLTVSWTLSYIFAGYCILPLLAMAYQKLRGHVGSLLTLWVLVLMVCFTLNLLTGSPIMRVCYIPAGCILAELVLSKQAALTSTGALMRTLALGLAFLALRFTLEPSFSDQRFLGELPRLLYFLSGLGAVSSFAILSIYASVDLSVKPVKWLSFIGKRGYSFYLLHGLVTKLFVFVFAFTLPGFHENWIASLGLMLVCLFATVVVSELSFQILECRAPALVLRLFEKFRFNAGWLRLERVDGM